MYGFLKDMKELQEPVVSLEHYSLYIAEGCSNVTGKEVLMPTIRFNIDKGCKTNGKFYKPYQRKSAIRDGKVMLKKIETEFIEELAGYETAHQ